MYRDKRQEVNRDKRKPEAKKWDRETRKKRLKRRKKEFIFQTGEEERGRDPYWTGRIVDWLIDYGHRLYNKKYY